MNKENLNPEDIQKLRSLIGNIKQVNVKRAIKDLQAGKALTKAQLKELEEFDEELKEAESQRSEEPQQFMNLRHVLVYLLERGYKVSVSNLYKHGKEGKIHPAPDGAYALKAVKTYALTYLKTVATGQTEKADVLARKHEKEKLLNMQLKNELSALKLKIQQGLYILRTLCHEELAARAIAIDHEYKFSLQANAAERVELVKGNLDKVEDLVRFDMQKHNELMNRFATLKEFHVIYEPDETKEA